MDAPITFRFSFCALSMNAARRWRIVSSTPPASPAFTMFTYSRSNAFGCLESASDRLEPLSTSSATCPTMPLSAHGFICCSRIFSERTIGRPAS